MTARKGLVLDANILLRAVFGERVRQILEAYEDQASFYTPEICFQDAQKYIPELSKRRKIDVDLALSVLDHISRIVEPVDSSLYEDYREAANARVLPRDPEDWPIAAVALLLCLPVGGPSRNPAAKEVLILGPDRGRVIPSRRVKCP